jgi:Tfp pilus assembly protein PilF
VHNNLGVVLSRQGKVDDAAAHYAEALRLDPDFADAHNNLGALLHGQGNYEASATHYAAAVRINPGHAAAHNNLGVVLCRRGKYEDAAAHYAEALRLNPNEGEALKNLAMMLAACPDAKHRDGKRAVEFASRACELSVWKRPDFLDALAAAHAEAGDFEGATGWQTKAIGLLGGEREIDAYRSRLALYRAKKPYREPLPEHARTELRP